LEPALAQRRRAGGGPAAEPDRRLAARQPRDLDVAPADPADAQAEHLADRLLGRPSTGERLRPQPDVALLARRQDPLREPLAEPLDRPPDPVDLDDVGAELGRAGGGIGGAAGTAPLAGGRPGEGPGLRDAGAR